ncbi:MAG: hypothetical protein ACJLUP_16685 [Agrobacterium tumefaciens]
MSPEQVEFLRTFDGLYHESMAKLPDGWIGPLVDMLQTLRQLSLVEPVYPSIETWVELRVERTAASGAIVFMTPLLPPDQWGHERALACLVALSAFGEASKATCEWCGQPGAPVQLGERVTFFLCEEHKSSAEEKLAAQVQAFDERVKFREKVSILFQKQATVWLNVSDHNAPILQEALTDIKKIVVDRDLVGKIFVTKITESEGQLFLSVRYDPSVDFATVIEIDDIVHHVHRLSDEASLLANRGGANDDA